MAKPVSRPDASKCTAKPCSALSARHSSEASLRLLFVTRLLSLFLMLTDLCVFFPSLFSPVIHMRSASAYPTSLSRTPCQSFCCKLAKTRTFRRKRVWGFQIANLFEKMCFSLFVNMWFLLYSLCPAEAKDAARSTGRPEGRVVSAPGPGSTGPLPRAFRGLGVWLSSFRLPPTLCHFEGVPTPRSLKLDSTRLVRKSFLFNATKKKNKDKTLGLNSSSG